MLGFVKKKKIPKIAIDLSEKKERESETERRLTFSKFNPEQIDLRMEKKEERLEL